MSKETSQKALHELLFKMADDALIVGHRNSEWTGIGPVLEEDITFSSLAQDKIGHAWNLYLLLGKEGHPDADTLAFKRKESEFCCCHLVEYPIGSYEFSLIRHFLFDHAEMMRYNALLESSYKPLANLAKKFRGEIKYHVFHADTWIKQLGNGNEESKSRLQSALHEAMPLALGIFEAGDFEDELASNGIFQGEANLKQRWLETVRPVVEQAGLDWPDTDSAEPALGGRKGYHTEHLQPLLAEMREVMDEDPDAEW